MGSLDGYRVLEFGGLGPAPFAAMMLSDMGADVIRIDRPGGSRPGFVDRPYETMLRNRTSVAIDLRAPRGVELALVLVEAADVVIEGYRPGVMERFGLGPDDCMARNQALVYARMTGWGQSGPLADVAGHDINYIALTGALHAIGKREQPSPPLALLGDIGGGGLMLALGITAALVERGKSGQGQVIDAAIVDGVLTMMSPFYGFHAAGYWDDRREANRLDGGAPYYRTYECADGTFISIGPLEPGFFSQLVEVLDLDAADVEDRLDPGNWDAHRSLFESIFRRRTRDEWCELLGDTDVCFAPVLTMAEAPDHPHLQARESFVAMDDQRVPAPAPRFSRTPSAIRRAPVATGTDSAAVLASLGVGSEEIEALIASGIVAGAPANDEP